MISKKRLLWALASGGLPVIIIWIWFNNVQGLGKGMAIMPMILISIILFIAIFVVVYLLIKA
ncbi:hypothetical protein AYK26_04070 [Euryarchaeota archaeon SM23-78]|nr:MAG: hypothetical protein AYK26_04070 [Euryarchaeota archaeon SM23-78]MBW3000959.1 hypothetical protein [Candidatus Woesearchaeota archaeon]